MEASSLRKCGERRKNPTSYPSRPESTHARPEAKTLKAEDHQPPKPVSREGPLILPKLRVPLQPEQEHAALVAGSGAMQEGLHLGALCCVCGFRIEGSFAVVSLVQNPDLVL